MGRALVARPLHFRQCPELKDIYWPYEPGQLKRLQGGSVYIDRTSAQRLLTMFMSTPKQDVLPRALHTQDETGGCMLQGRSAAVDSHDPNKGLDRVCYKEARVEVKEEAEHMTDKHAENLLESQLGREMSCSSEGSDRRTKVTTDGARNRVLDRLFPFMGPSQSCSSADASAKVVRVQPELENLGAQGGDVSVSYASRLVGLRPITTAGQIRPPSGPAAIQLPLGHEKRERMDECW